MPATIGGPLFISNVTCRCMTHKKYVLFSAACDECVDKHEKENRFLQLTAAAVAQIAAEISSFP